MKYAKMEMRALSIACSLLLNASIIYTAIIGPRIGEPDGSRLLKAMLHKNIKTVQEVLTRRQIDLHGNLSLDRTPLHWAAIKGHADIAQLLLKAGTSVNVRDSHKRTPLHRAAATGNEEVVQLLIKHKADIEARDDEGQTPLSKALNFKNANTIRALIAAGADVSLRLQSVVQMLTTCDERFKETYRNKIRMLVQGGMKVEQDLLFRLDNANEKRLAQGIISIRRSLLNASERALRAQLNAEKRVPRKEQAQLNAEKRALDTEMLQGLRSMTAEEFHIHQKHLELLSRGGDAIL